MKIILLEEEFIRRWIEREDLEYSLIQLLWFYSTREEEYKTKRFFFILKRMIHP